MKGHKAHHHGKHHKKAGGSVELEGEKEAYGGGDPDVVKEAEQKKKGGKVHGHKGKHRMDRRATGGVVRATGGGVPGRKRGGRVGADTSPLTTAHNTSSPARDPKEEEGGLSA